jgi:uncharacterized protein YegL
MEKVQAYGKAGTAFLLSLLVSFFVILFCIFSQRALASSELITDLRNYFSIDFHEATDSQLEDFLKDTNNRAFIEAMLKQIKYGKEVQLFLDQRVKILQPDMTKETLRYLAKKFIIDLLKLIGDKANIFWLSTGSELVGVLSTISKGIDIFFKLADALAAFDRREIIRMYIQDREAGMSSSQAFEDLYNTFQPVIDKIICLRLLCAGPTKEEKQNFATYLEFCYQSWKLFNDRIRRDDVKRYVLNNLPKSTIQPISAVETATVLVMDVSGSMSWQWRGGVKIESAKKAALQYIEQVANEPRPVGVTHYIGVVTFSDSASVVCPLTTSYDAAKKTVISLGTIAWTNLGAGLDTALQELSKLPAGAKKFIILLSDGMTNRGKSRESILQTSVAEARRQGICIHTVGFGDPGDIDEDFLKKIATQSGCGSYNYASSGFELFTTYVKVRHATLGSNRFVEYKTTTPAYFFPGESITLGAFQLTAPAQELHYTVAWSGPVVLQAKLVDPQGRVVDNRYPNSVIYSGSGFSHVTVFSPIPGIWRAAATVKSAAMQPAEYYGVASARTGGYVIPYIPPPCLVKADNTCVIPMPDLPTAVVVAIGVAVWIWWFYNQIFK